MTTELKDKDIRIYLEIALTFSKLSNAERLKVAAIVVKDRNIIAVGVNGMPSGWSNVCEYEDEDGNLVTKPEVLHAESNALSKLAKSTISSEGADMFLTHSPCFACSRMIYQAGIRNIYYIEEYRIKDGVEFLEKCDGINVHKININS